MEPTLVTGTGVDVTVRVTLTKAAAPVDVMMVTEPVYVPAVKPLAFAATMIMPGTEPEVGLADNQVWPVVVVAVP